MNGQKIDAILRWLDSNDLNPKGYDNITKDKINSLYELTDKIKPLADDEFKVIYFSVPTGTVEDYIDYYDPDNEFTREQMIESFKESYPEEKCWYRMCTSKYKEYRVITMNTKTVINANMEETTCWEYEDLHEFLDFLINKAKEVIKMLENNTYDDYIKDYSPRNKFGSIIRKDFYDMYPEYRKRILEEMSNKEIDYFIKYATEKTEKRLKQMTSSKYFELTRIAYESLNYETEGKTDLELYKRYADNRDGGLPKIDPNNSEEFDSWYKSEKWDSSHLYEIIMGSSRTRIHLHILNDENGYYFKVTCHGLLCKTDVARIYNALYKKDIPICIYNKEEIINSLKETDYIGIVPDYIFPFSCSSWFEKNNPKEYYHAPDEKIYDKLDWEPLDKVELK